MYCFSLDFVDDTIAKLISGLRVISQLAKAAKPFDEMRDEFGEARDVIPA